MLALFHIAAGRPADAEPYLSKLASLSKDAETQLVLADYYLASNRKDKALPLLQKVASTPSRGEADLRLARLDLREGRRDAARQRLDGLLEREPGNAAALVLQAEILDADGKRDEALGRLQAAVSANPSLAEAQFALGRAYRRPQRSRPGDAGVQRDAATQSPRRRRPGGAVTARALRRPRRQLRFSLPNRR